MLVRWSSFYNSREASRDAVPQEGILGGRRRTPHHVCPVNQRQLIIQIHGRSRSVINMLTLD